MFFFRHKRQKPDEPISAQMLADMAETCDQMSRITAVPPLEFSWTPAGPVMRLAGMLFGAYVGVTSGTISPRSGLTPGTGTVVLYSWNGTALAATPNSKTVFSISSTTGGIPTGTVVIILRIAGAYWIITADCGN